MIETAHTFRVGACILAAIGVFALGACSSPEPPIQPAGTVQPVEQVQPTAAVVETIAPEPSPEATAQSEPTAEPVATNVPAPVPTATSTPSPTAPPTAGYADVVEVQPTPLAALTTISEFGFDLKVERETQVSSAGLGESEASAERGVLRFAYGGVNALLRWVPAEGATPNSTLAESFSVLRASQPALEFNAVSEGETTVDGQPAVFGGFAAADSSGTVLGGGLIGAWICQSPDRSFSLTVTGQGATTAQIRFQNLLDNFSCSAQ